MKLEGRIWVSFNKADVCLSTWLFCKRSALPLLSWLIGIRVVCIDSVSLEVFVTLTCLIIGKLECRTLVIPGLTENELAYTDCKEQPQNSSKKKEVLM